MRNKLPPIDQMPEKKLPALRTILMIVRYGAAIALRKEKDVIHQAAS